MWCVESYRRNRAVNDSNWMDVDECWLRRITLVDHDTAERVVISPDELAEYKPLGYVPVSHFTDEFYVYFPGMKYKVANGIVVPYDVMSYKFYTWTEDVEFKGKDKYVYNDVGAFVPADIFYSVWLVNGRVCTLRDALVYFFRYMGELEAYGFQKTNILCIQAISSDGMERTPHFRFNVQSGVLRYLTRNKVLGCPSGKRYNVPDLVKAGG